jgi:hypothetical protein
MNLNDPKIQQIQAEIAKNGRASAYVTFDDYGNMGYEDDEDFIGYRTVDGDYVANVKIYEVIDGALDAKEYSGCELMINIEDIKDISF